RLSVDDFEVEEEIWPDLPCPYCYEDHDLASLCSHLEEEHPFESKVCPICSVKIMKDMLNHIIVQHGHLLKVSFYKTSLAKLKFQLAMIRISSKTDILIKMFLLASFDSSMTHEEREQKRKHATTRATFVQDLLLSTLFTN
ncbi:hypothetical protein GW17_00033092, partial [Ensete ventricosum]